MCITILYVQNIFLTFSDIFHRKRIIIDKVVVKKHTLKYKNITCGVSKNQTLKIKNQKNPKHTFKKSEHNLKIFKAPEFPLP